MLEYLFHAYKALLGLIIYLFCSTLTRVTCDYWSITSIFVSRVSLYEDTLFNIRCSAATASPSVLCKKTPT